MIRVRNLKKSYGQFPAVDDISFDIATGEVVGFLGPNGAGKTTTMRILTGFLGKDAGTVEIDGIPIDGATEEAKGKFGYLPENNPLYEDMGVVEYLEFVGEMRGMSKALRAQRIERNVKLYGLTEVAYKDISELSKGYRQRVGLAQASLNDPPILILDEPTSGLDPNQIIEIRNLIKETGKTKTVILSTHNLSEVEATCNRILIINKGKIVADKQVDEIGQEARKVMVHARIKGEGDLMADLKKIDAVKEIVPGEVLEGFSDFKIYLEGALTGDQYSEIVFDLAVQKGWKLAKLRTQTVSLEDVFTKLTKG